MTQNTETTETPLTPLAASVSEYVRAAFSGLLIETDEPIDVLRGLHYLCERSDWRLATWNLATGTPDGQHTGDPINALSVLDEADGEQPLLLLAFGMHRFLNSPEFIAQLERRLYQAKTQRATLLLMVPSGGVDLPPELKPLFVTVRHDRPDRHELAEIAYSIATEDNERPEDLSFILDAAAGMTRLEAESAYALSLVRHGSLQAGPLWDLKTEAVRASGLMSLWRGSYGFHTLQGLEALKDFTFKSLTSKRACKKGVLLLSPPGCGKSQFAKTLSAETGRPLLSLDIGRLLGSLVGESERNLRQALTQAEAMSPCILLIDEVEKALPNSGDRDSGVGSRLLGTLLMWMQERTSDVYIVMTSNESRRLPPELTRAERLDATFFIDLPDEATRADIWKHYLEAYCHDAESDRPGDANWTGAEIQSCCRIGRLIGVSVMDAAKYVVPVATTSDGRVNRLRQWASGRTLDAHAAGLYRMTTKAIEKKRRSVTPKPSDN